MKAFLRGLCIQQVAKTKKASRDWEKRIREELVYAEREYIEDPTLDKQRIWLNKQQDYKNVRIRKSENKKLFQKQVAFGEGENVGRMLAHLVRTNSSPSTITAIKKPSGEISTRVSEITDTFREYYDKLYKWERRSWNSFLRT